MGAGGMLSEIDVVKLPKILSRLSETFKHFQASLPTRHGSKPAQPMIHSFLNIPLLMDLIQIFPMVFSI